MYEKVHPARSILQEQAAGLFPSGCMATICIQMEWEWDDAKDVANIEKHGISFEAALQVFIDPDGVEKEDLSHSSTAESRLWRTGKMKSGRIVTVVYTLLDNRIRLISAQERRRERREYEKAKKRKGD